MMTRRRILLLCLTAFLCRPAWAEIDRQALYKHIQKTQTTLPPGIEMELKNVKPSPIAGYLSGEIELRYHGNVQSEPILLSEDGRWYFLSDAFELSPSKLKEFLGPKEREGAENPPPVYVTKDMKHFLIGQLNDLTVDPDKKNEALLKLSGAPYRGAEKAPITIVEFSDLECPYCRNAHQALDQQLMQAYPNQIRWIFKNFPLTNIHPWAYNAAIANSCALREKPEAAFKLQSALFDQQEKITPANFRETAIAEAEKAGLNKDKFTLCLDKQESKDLVEADIAEAAAMRVNSTPTFFINGHRLQGFSGFDSIKSAIDDKLAEAPKTTSEKK